MDHEFESREAELDFVRKEIFESHPQFVQKSVDWCMIWMANEIKALKIKVIELEKKLDI